MGQQEDKREKHILDLYNDTHTCVYTRTHAHTHSRFSHNPNCFCKQCGCSISSAPLAGICFEPQLNKQLCLQCVWQLQATAAAPARLSQFSLISVSFPTECSRNPTQNNPIKGKRDTRMLQPSRASQRGGVLLSFTS